MHEWEMPFDILEETVKKEVLEIQILEGEEYDSSLSAGSME